MNKEETDEIVALIDRTCNPITLPTERQAIIGTIIDKYVTSAASSPILTLGSLIYMLGNYISSENDQIRVASYQLLLQFLKTGHRASEASAKLQQQQSNDANNATLQQNEQVVNSVCKFFGDRLHDFEGLPELLPCILALLQRWTTKHSENHVAYVMTQYVV